MDEIRISHAAAAADGELKPAYHHACDRREQLIAAVITRTSIREFQGQLDARQCDRIQNDKHIVWPIIIVTVCEKLT